jgi:hypothetical protein
MRSRLAGAAVLVVLVAAIVWFVGRDGGARERAPAASPAEVPPAAERATLPAPLRRRPTVRLAMPAPAVAEVVVPEACAHGTGGMDAWWACLPRDPAWDAERARYLLDRIRTHVGLALDPSRIECRARCCRLRITHEENRAHGGDLSSSVGVRVGPTDGYLRDVVNRADPDGDVLVTTCWKQGRIEEFPDRAIEREIVLAEAAGDLAVCGRLADAPAEATLNVELADDGAIDTISHAMIMPRPVMECISAALRKVGVFEPAPTTMDRMIPMRVRLRS